MKIDVEVISREIIKPATSTPDHLHHYKFSFLDQLTPSSFYIPLIYFYSLDHKLSNNEKSTHLKTSLSKVLHHYYPLAGFIKENYIDCKNGGVLVLEAQVNCQLSEILQSPNPDKFVNKFLPDDANNLVLAIQVNFFSCGSVAIGVLISHKIADASSILTFVKNWAETGRGNGDNIVPPKFVGATLFPPKDGIRSLGTFVAENVVLNRFVFTDSKIAALKGKYVISSTDKGRIYPTRYEALSCFLFSRFAASTEVKEGHKKSYLLISPVNLRKRMDPPLLDDCFGNISGSAKTFISLEDDIGENGYSYGLVNKLKEEIKKINKDYVKKLEDGILDFDLNTMEVSIEDKPLKQEMDFFSCSSYCRFPTYEADFGWGRPVWVAFGDLSQRNSTVLMDNRTGDGIEAWIHLTKEDMAIFETDEELLTYASPTSCP
ncbi:hypothetical protein ACOSQ2_014961 [Xanthoceras sorbifolium]